MSGNDGFLSRWSRLKREAEKETDETDAISDVVELDASDGAAEAEAEADVAETEEAEELSDAEILERFDLKDPDELGPGDDFSGFMRAAVPEHLRRRALRTLWRSNPVLANLDGLNDYDGDWSGGSVPAGQLKTAYRVGLGFVRDVVETAGKLATETDAAETGSESGPETAAAPDSEIATADTDNAIEDSAEPDEAVEYARLSARKRMTFRIGDE